jgi:hypothetical protein
VYAVTGLLRPERNVYATKRYRPEPVLPQGCDAIFASNASDTLEHGPVKYLLELLA